MSTENLSALTLAQLSSYRGILFDLDGTLIDHTKAAREGARRFALRLGLQPEVDRWMEIERKWFLAFERAEVSHQGQRYERIREYFSDPEITDEEAARLFGIFVEEYANSWEAFPDATEALEAALAQAERLGGKVGVFTNGALEMQRAKLERTGLDFEGLVMLTATQLGAAKPQPESYRGAASRLGLKAQDCVVIGDSLEADVLGARAYGMAAIHLDRSGETPDSIASLSALRWD